MQKIDTKTVQTLFQNGVCSTRFLANIMFDGPEWEEKDAQRMAAMRTVLRRLLDRGRVRKASSSTWALLPANDES